MCELAMLTFVCVSVCACVSVCVINDYTGFKCVYNVCLCVCE